MSAQVFAVEHRVSHTVSEPVPAAYARVLLSPRDGSGQQVHRSRLSVTPAAREVTEHEDLDRNRVTYVHVAEPHQRLELCASSVVSVTRRAPRAQSVPDHTWDRVVAAVHRLRSTGRGDQGESPTTVLGIVAAALPSELVEPDEAVLEYALPSFGPGTPLLAVVEALVRRTSEELTIVSGRYDGNLHRLLAQRSGTDEDVSHLVCAALRSLGLAARYVSGYRYVPGQRRSACRSWVAVWLPGGGWIHADPVAGTLVDDAYVALAWGRDARDVEPLRGIVLSTGARSQVSDHATLTPLSAEQLAAARGQQAP